jgi:hypothetical protein
MKKALALLTLLLCVASVPAWSQGTITHNDANFVRGTTPWDSSPGADFTGVSATLTQDHVFESGWAFRVSGDTQETFFPTPTSQSYVGDTSTIDWSDVGGRGLFSAQEVAQVIDTDGPSGYVTVTMTLTNISAAPVPITVFNMLDIDLAGSTNDSATLIAPNYHLALTDPSGNTAEYRGLGASAFLVRPFGATDIGAVLSDTAVTDFDNTGLPFGPGDFTGGFQWGEVTIPVSGAAAFTAVFAVNTGALPVELQGFSVE